MKSFDEAFSNLGLGAQHKPEIKPVSTKTGIGSDTPIIEAPDLGLVEALEAAIKGKHYATIDAIQAKMNAGSREQKMARMRYLIEEAKKRGFSTKDIIASLGLTDVKLR